MSTFYGLMTISSHEYAKLALEKMFKESTKHWKFQEASSWVKGQVGFGQLLRRVTPEDEREALPFFSPPYVICGSFYLSNRDALIDTLNDRRIDPQITDGQLVMLLWHRFKMETLNLLDGIWAFAVYDCEDNSLIIAQCASKGVTYYARTDNNFYFSTSVQEILCQADISREPNLDYLIEGFINSQRQAKPDETGFKGIFQIPKGHYLYIQGYALEVRRWWQPERLSPLIYRNAEEYDDAFKDLFFKQVSTAVRTSSSKVASHLSSGIDSSAVLVAALTEISSQKKKVISYTHTPNFRTPEVSPKIQYDEWPIASTVAEMYQIRHEKVLCTDVSIYDAILLDASLHASPAFGSNNLYWLHEINRLATANGANICLTGQAGNSSISYTGNPSLWPLVKQANLSFVFRELYSERGGLIAGLENRLLKPVFNNLRYTKLNSQYQRSATKFLTKEWRDSIRFNKYLGNQELLRQFRAFEHIGLVRPGNMVNSEYFGITIVDPTSLKAIMEFCGRIPEHIVWRHGEQRSMIRNAMRKHLPNSVLYPTKKGKQSADLAHRLSKQFFTFEATFECYIQNPVVQEVLDVEAVVSCIKKIKSGQNVGISLSQITRCLSLMAFLTQF